MVWKLFKRKKVKHKSLNTVCLSFRMQYSRPLLTTFAQHKCLHLSLRKISIKITPKDNIDGIQEVISPATNGVVFSSLTYLLCRSPKWHWKLSAALATYLSVSHQRPHRCFYTCLPWHDSSWVLFFCVLNRPTLRKGVQNIHKEKWFFLVLRKWGVQIIQ